MGMEFFCTGFQWAMVEDHFVKIAKGEEEGVGETLAAKLPLSVKKMIFQRHLGQFVLVLAFHNISSSFQDGIRK